MPCKNLITQYIKHGGTIMSETTCQLPSKEVMLDKIRGCWIGKNIGGTLGAPMECDTSMHDISWFTKEPDGNPLPNDDLDLQLAWLVMAEFYGLEHINSRHFGEMWANTIIGPWGEYANCRYNCNCGFFPPLSGSCDNDGLNRSNGAWIRAEIWACLCAGRPDDAIRYAWMDASCDHITDGIYAEMFVAAMEAAAFCVSDIRQLITIGLCKIPDECRLRESIELAISYYDRGETWQDARNAVVKLNEDMGWFQAPANVAFTVIALLYGEGDFGKTICTAVNCGDDTDCTAATAGALLGIVYGNSGLPEKWKSAVGDALAVISLHRFSIPAAYPQTVTELTARVARLRDIGELYDPDFLTPDADFTSRQAAELIWKKSSYQLEYNLIFANISVEYLDKPYLVPGKPNRVRVGVDETISSANTIFFHWNLPEDYQCDSPSFDIGSRNYCVGDLTVTITPPEEINESMIYLELEVSSSDHQFPTPIIVPFRKAGSTNFPKGKMNRNSNACRRMFAINKRIAMFRK